MRLDGGIREMLPPNIKAKGGKLPTQTGYIAGSKAMESLHRLITSIESFFHPSNTGLWTLSVRCCFICRLHLTHIPHKKAHDPNPTLERRIHEALERRRTGNLQDPCGKYNFTFSSATC